MLQTIIKIKTGIAALFILFCIGTADSLAQNSVLNTLITVEFHNSSITECLDKMKELSKLEFSYNSKIIPKDKTINRSFKNRTVSFILKELFKDSQLTFKESNGVIIVYKDAKKSSSKTKSHKIKPKFSVRIRDSINIITLYDTVINVLHDTIITQTFDTLHIVQHDTIFHHDTIVTQIQHPKRQNLKWIAGLSWEESFLLNSNNVLESKNNDLLNKEIHDVYKFTALIGYQMILGFDYKQFSFQSGVQYNTLSEKFTVTVPIPEIDIQHSGTIIKNEYWQYNWDSIYDVDKSIWNTFIYDSTYVTKIDTLKETTIDTLYNNTSFKTVNRFNFIEIPILFGWKFRHDKKLSISLQTGIGLHFLSGVKSKFLTFDQFSPIIDGQTTNYRAFFTSFQFGGQISWSINKYLNPFAGVSYQKYLNSLYNSNYPIETNYQFINAKAGLFVYF